MHKPIIHLAPNAWKLKDDDRAIIRKMRESGERVGSIAKRFNISFAYAQDICHGIYKPNSRSGLGLKPGEQLSLEFIVCRKCKQTKPRNEFPKSESSETISDKSSLCYPCRARSRDGAALKYNYGITLDDYDRILAEQGGGCAICGAVELRRGRFGVVRLSVDHCHKTGKIRGPLCYRCNSVIGFARETKSVLSSAIEYLNKHSAESPANERGPADALKC